MQGIGILRSRLGDEYRGQFCNHMYEGIGLFTKASGEAYMGYFKEVCEREIEVI
jgi:hypothetical protein